MTARDVAFKVLWQVERADAFLSVALDAAIRAAGALPPRDAALATELAYGVARRALALDAALAAHSRRPLSKLDDGVLVALRLGAYQILFLDRVPAHAAVGETVEALKRAGLARAAGFVNAVLRQLARAPTIPLPEDPLERLGVEESHPGWLVRRWAARMGLDAARELCRADNLPAPVCVRVNSTRATREEVSAALAKAGVRAEPTSLSPVGLLLSDAGPVASLEPFENGLLQVQDEAAQLVTLLGGPGPGMRVLDVCAAPGGKCCHLAEHVGPDGEIVALDVHPRKLERLVREAERMGVASVVRPRACDAERPLPFPEASFDLVLVDAPCSGLGTLRRHPELRYRRTEADLPRLAALQRSLALNARRHLKPGGAMVYSVCSMEPEEGEGQIDALLAAGLEVVPPAAPGVDWARIAGPAGGILTLPHRDGADGFFAARLVLS